MAIIKYILFILTVIIFFFCGCAGPPQEKWFERVTIALQNWEGYGPLYLAQEKGFFKEEGFELFFVDEQLDSARRDAFKAGMLDCEAGTIDLLVSKRAQDTPIVAVLVLDRSFGADAVVVSQNIRSLKDLIGKKVVLARDDVGETFLSFLCYQQQIPFHKLVIIPRRPEEVAEPFLNGKADAVATWEPQVSKALARPGAHILYSSRDMPGVIIDTLNVREDLVKNKPKLVKGLIHGWFKAVKYCQEHPVEASGIIAKHYNLTAEEYRKHVQGLQWIDYTEQDESAEIKTWVDTFDRITNIKYMNGRISKKPDAATAINGTLLIKLYENSQ